MFGWFPRHVDGRGDGDIHPNSRPKTRKIKNVSAAMVCCDAFCISTLIKWQYRSGHYKIQTITELKSARGILLLPGCQYLHTYNTWYVHFHQFKIFSSTSFYSTAYAACLLPLFACTKVEYVPAPLRTVISNPSDKKFLHVS